MRSYSTVSPKLWIGRTGRSLRRCLEAQVVAAYLISSPHDNMLGLYYLPLESISNDTGLTREEVNAGMNRCIEVGFCQYDGATEMVWVINMAKYQVGSDLKVNDNKVRGVRAAYADLPENPFLGPFFDRYAKDFHLETRREGKPLASPFQAPLEGLGSPLPEPPAPPPTAASLAPPTPAPKVKANGKPRKPRGRDYGIAALDMPEEIAEQFQRVWDAWPTKGWNSQTRTAGPRRLNFAESAKRFLEAASYNTIEKEDGSRLTAADLAEAAIHFVNLRVKEAGPGTPPFVPCIENFFSSVEGKKHPWKEAVLSFFQMVEEAPR